MSVQRPPTSLPAMLISAVAHRKLIFELSKREVVGRYRGSFMGLAWAFFNPLLMLTVYSFVFGGVFGSRWAGQDDNMASFAVTLFVGLIVHGFFAENINRAPSLIIQNPSYVKKVLFPLEVLSWVAVLSASFHALISLIVLLAVHAILNGVFLLTSPLIVLVFVPLALFTVGANWFLSSLAVYVRDVGQGVGVVASVMLFLAPIFYPRSALPPRLQFLIQVNPLTFPIEEARRVLLYGQPSNPMGWLIYGALSVCFAWAGFWWFQRTRRGFADVM